ncbi:MAG: type II toxin-antitoxin system RelE/ParE family toxin [Rhodospirillaceae bacterium]
MVCQSWAHWMYEYLFAKKDRANIEENELAAFRLLADSYAGLSDNQIALLFANSDITEICNGHQS